MAVDRPTFHEAWHRVVNLRPRLLSSVHVFRQHFRGQLWYVIENTANNQFSRLNTDAYAFVGLLDGHRTVGQVWTLCCERQGDRAPTQGEVIQILGQLYGGNLLYVDLPPDSEALFNRYKKRVTRQVQSHLMSLLYIRIPLLDPDWILNRWVTVVGVLYTWFGFVTWLALLGVGLFFVISNFPELTAQSRDTLAPGNLVYLYLTFVVLKICHEFSHAFSCKKFGRVNRNGGQVHTMGVMFLVFFPLPYVDASSAWTFPNKWHRMVVGLAGMMAELALAAVAAIVWAHTSTGALHIIAYNVIFVASVSTLLFNGNALLRFDAYYVLADLLEIPNLSQRSNAYLYYLVKRFVWGLKKAYNPAHTLGERFWFVFYGLASTGYRIFICIRILIFLKDRLPEQFFIVVPVFAFSAVVAWVLVPVGKFFKYLFTGPELTRNRSRALATSLLTIAGLTYALGIVEVPYYNRMQGVVEPNNLTFVYAEVDGFVQDFTASCEPVEAQTSVLVHADNRELAAQMDSLRARRRRLEVQEQAAQLEEMASVQILQEQIQALDEQIQRVTVQQASLDIRAPETGTWYAPNIDHQRYAYVPRGQPIGKLAVFDRWIVRAVTPQKSAARLLEADQTVQMRIQGYPDHTLLGTIEKIAPMGQDRLPSEALAYQAGGSTPVKSRDAAGRTTTAEKIFEVRIRLDPEPLCPIKAGQRLMVRFRLGSKPLVVQWYQAARQLLQRRFYI